MANQTTATTFENLFEGMNLSQDFQSKLKEVFDGAVAQKIQECSVSPEEMDEDTSVVVDDLVEADTSIDSDIDPVTLANDIEMRKILNAFRINPSAFARSLAGAIADVDGNPVADDSLTAILEILSVIADNPSIATRVAADIKKRKDDAAEPAMEEGLDEDIPDTLEDDLNDIELMGMNEDLIVSVNKYLTYVAESWVEDNKLAIEEGIKTELTESFMAGLKNLFSEHNIQVPEATNIVDSLVSKVATLEEQLKTNGEELKKKLNEETEKTLRFKKKLNVQTSEVIFEKVAVANKLSLTQKEKFKMLTESIEFTDDATYHRKLQNLVTTLESDKKTNKVRLTEDSMQDSNVATNPPEIDPVIGMYYKAISVNTKF